MNSKPGTAWYCGAFAAAAQRGFRGIAASAAGIVFLLVPAGTARTAPVDHIVAAVNNEVITAGELRQAVALNERIGKPATDREALQRDTLAGLITRRLLVQEAERLKFVEVSADDLDAALKSVKARFASSAAFDEFLRNTDLTQQELSRMLGEQLLVEKFAAKKVGLFVRVTHDELERYFEEHASSFPGKRFPDVQKSISDFLTNGKINQQLDAYIAELRAKADIRVNP